MAILTWDYSTGYLKKSGAMPSGLRPASFSAGGFWATTFSIYSYQAIDPMSVTMLISTDVLRIQKRNNPLHYSGFCGEPHFRPT